MNLFRNNKKKPESFIKGLIEYLSKKDIKLTFELNNEWYKYQVLSLGNGEYGYESANNTFKRYISEVREKLDINFDEESAFVFAKIINMGDNFDYLFSDYTEKIYHFNSDNGWEPETKIVAKNLSEMTGDFQIEDIKNSTYHISFAQPTYRIKNLIDYNRVIEIEIHGFLIDQYENLLANLVAKNNDEFSIDGFEYEKIDWNDKTKTYYPVELKINNVDYQIQIEKSKWFDFNFAKQINPILKKIGIDKTIQILHEEDWDEKHAICILNQEEYKILRENRVIIE